MSAISETPRVTSSALWIGRVLSGLVVAFLLLDGAIKLVPIAEVTQTMQQLGYSGSVAQARGLGVLTLVCALLYAFPRTAILGAILLTGLLGGAMATHLRADSPIVTQMAADGFVRVDGDRLVATRPGRLLLDRLTLELATGGAPA